jgi:hypothetical protein
MKKIKKTILILDKVTSNNIIYSKESFNKTDFDREYAIVGSASITGIEIPVGKCKLEIKDNKLISNGELNDDYDDINLPIAPIIEGDIIENEDGTRTIKNGKIRAVGLVFQHSQKELNEEDEEN